MIRVIYEIYIHGFFGRNASSSWMSIFEGSFDLPFFMSSWSAGMCFNCQAAVWIWLRDVAEDNHISDMFFIVFICFSTYGDDASTKPENSSGDKIRQNTSYFTPLALVSLPGLQQRNRSFYDFLPGLKFGWFRKILRKWWKL